jgi:hypothetical protein
MSFMANPAARADFPDSDGGVEVSPVLRGILFACLMARGNDKRQESQGDR